MPSPKATSVHRSPPSEPEVGDSKAVPTERWRRKLRQQLLIGGIWIIPALLTSAQIFLTLDRRGLEPSAAVVLGFQALVWLPWALLTPWIFRWAKRYPFSGGRRLASASRHFAISCTMTLFVLGYIALLESVRAHGIPGLAPDLLITWFGRVAAGNSVLYFLLYWAVLGICVAVVTYRTLERRERSHLALETQLAQAQLSSLEAQLRPHFLFNTLHSVSALIEDDPVGARRMLARLGELLRASLRHRPVQEISLAEEFELVDLYLEIERTRFGERLRVERRQAPGVERALVPYLILQPLVENAIRHAVAVDPKAGCVEIVASRDDQILTLSVIDDGPGPGRSVASPSQPGRVPEGPTAADRPRIGIANTRERLETLYPGASNLTLLAGPEGGCEVRITLPFRCQPRPIEP